MRQLNAQISRDISWSPEGDVFSVGAVPLQLKEIDIIEKVEKLCNPEDKAGHWITHYDLVEDNGALQASAARGLR